MVQRQPTPSERPDCYFTGYGQRRCRECDHTGPCEERALRWLRLQSLTQALADLETAVSPRGSTDPMEIYSRVYEKHYGRRPKRAALLGKSGSFYRLKFYCENNNLDMATFVTAQIHMATDFLQHLSKRRGHKMTFQPNLLFMRGFETRLNAYLRTANRRRRSDDTALDSRTKLTRFSRMMEEDEEEVARYFVATHVNGKPVPWGMAVQRIKPRVQWLAIDLAWRDEIKDLDNKVHAIEVEYGRDNVRKTKALAELRVAVRVAESYAHGLPDRLGCHDRFHWLPFAKLLARLCGGRERRQLAVTGIDGKMWRGNG